MHMESSQNPASTDERSKNNNIKPVPAAPKFQSWAILCQGTNRNYPNTNDVFHSQIYAKKPESPHTTYNRGSSVCRICTETHQEINNFHGGKPLTHCLYWTRRSVTHRAESARQAKYCPKCLNPENTTKDTNLTQHHCKITTRTKDKFSCLSSHVVFICKQNLFDKLILFENKYCPLI